MNFNITATRVIKKFSLCKKSYLFIIFFILCFQKLFAQPVITSLQPSQASIGASVVIEGAGFSPSINDNIVLFNTIKATIIEASPGKLTVVVPTGATYGPVTVISKSLAATSLKPFSVQFESCPDLNNESFLPGKYFNTSSYYSNLAAGDLDMDGKPDLAITNTYANVISILRNNEANGELAFSPNIDFAISPNPQKIILTDLDGDGRQEITVLSSSAISILENLSSPGVISFASKIDFATSNPADFSVCDINADGKMDLIVANNYTISIYRNTSSTNAISFAARIDLATFNLRPAHLATGDVNGDSKPDIAIVSNSNYNDSIAIFKNKSNLDTISFDSRISIPYEGGATGFSIGDIDGDDLSDLVVANAYYDKISIFRHSSMADSIAFEPPTELSDAQRASAIFIGDVSGDSNPEITSTSSYSGSVSIFKNNSHPGVITFANKTDYPKSGGPGNISLADFDMNGKPDISVSSYYSTNISILLKVGSQKIFLVDSSKLPGNPAIGLCKVNGSDWANACNNLQTALNTAQDGDQIWVAKGTYFPSADSLGSTSPGEPANKTFFIKNGVKIYGGFSGTETNSGQRNSALNMTILNGNTRTGKVKNVVWFSHVFKPTVVNGFTIKNGAATGNNAGGGIYMNASNPEISNCIITNSSSQNLGGAIYLYNSSPSFINCSIYSNSAAYGAAIAAKISSPLIVNCTIVKNNASKQGGGLYSEEGLPEIVNSIVWGNTNLNKVIDNISSTSGFLNVSYSIIGQAKDVYPGTGNQNANPLFVDGANNNFSLINGAWAVNAGNVNAYPSSAPATDLAGNARIKNDTIGLGAYQEGKTPIINDSGIIYVNRNQTNIFSNGNSWATAYANLSDAISVSNHNKKVSAIWISKGIYAPTNDRNDFPVLPNIATAEFAIKHGVDLYGGFNGTEKSIYQRDITKNETIFDGGDGLSDYDLNIGHIFYISNPDTAIRMDGFTIQNGYNIDGAINLYGTTFTINNCKLINNLGSAIYTWYSDLRITNCYFSGNRGNGAAVSNNNSTVSISDCNFTKNNNEYFGGAISNAVCSVSITRCNFTENKAIHIGGAIYNSNNSPSVISNCKFTGNQCEGTAGAVYNNKSDATFINCAFVKNYAVTSGAIRNEDSKTTLINCSITNNHAYAYAGIVNGIYDGPSKITISNSIIWGNQGIEDTIGNNLYDYTSGSPTGNFKVDHSIIGYGKKTYPGTGNLNLNPLFKDTANADVTLLPNSPAIDAGYNAAYTGDLNKDLDLAGAPRLTGTNIDIGAIEFTTVVLSVDWVSFNAIKENNNAILTWEVANQSGNDHFEIEFATDGATFSLIGKVSATKNDIYSFTDINFSRAKGSYVYYRIKQVDKDGKFSYSQVQKLPVTENGFMFNIVENPVRDNSVKVNIQSNSANKGTFIISDMRGRQMYSGTINWLPGNSIRSIYIPFLPAGTYFAIMLTDSGKYQVKFIK